MNPERQQANRAAGGVNENVRHQPCPLGNEELVKFVGHGVKQDNAKRKPGITPDPRA